MADGLTVKQQRFCEEYLVDFNATQAAIRAGYSEQTAKEIGCQNLTKLNIQQKVSELIEAISEKTQITVERVLREYAKIAFFNPQDLFDGDGHLKNIQDMDPDTAAVIAGSEIAELRNIKNDDEIITQVLKKVRHVDKVKALDSLAKHLGMFVDKVAFTGRNGRNEALENILAEAEAIANKVAKKHNLSDGGADGLN